MGKLKPKEDAFGQTLWAAHNGKEVFEIVERDDCLINALKTTGYFSNFEDWSPTEQKAMEFVKGRVLDIGCGAGRHTLHLQKKSFDVLGTDISPLAIKVCRSRGVRKTEVISIDDLNFSDNSFDTIILMGCNFGLLGSFEKGRRLLRRFHRITSWGALIIGSTRDPYKTDNPAHLEYHKLNKKRGRMAGQVKIRSRHEKYIGKWFDYLLVSKEEMKEILKGTGWTVRKFIDSNDSEYIAIIRKEA